MKACFPKWPFGETVKKGCFEIHFKEWGVRVMNIEFLLSGLFLFFSLFKIIGCASIVYMNFIFFMKWRVVEFRLNEFLSVLTRNFIFIVLFVLILFLEGWLDIG